MTAMIIAVIDDALRWHRNDAHHPPPLLCTRCSTSVASSRAEPTPVSLKTLAPFPATKRDHPLRFGGWLLCLFCFLMLSYHHLIAWGKALLLSSSPVVAILYFFGTCGAPAGQQLDPWPWHPNPFALMVVGIESLVAACDMVKKRAFSPCGHQPFLLPIWRCIEVLASENTDNGSRETMPTGERDTVWHSHTIRLRVPRLNGTDPRWYESANIPQFHRAHWINNRCRKSCS